MQVQLNKTDLKNAAKTYRALLEPHFKVKMTTANDLLAQGFGANNWSALLAQMSDTPSVYDINLKLLHQLFWPYKAQAFIAMETNPLSNPVEVIQQAFNLYESEDQKYYYYQVALPLIVLNSPFASDGMDDPDSPTYAAWVDAMSVAAQYIEEGMGAYLKGKVSIMVADKWVKPSWFDVSAIEPDKNSLILNTIEVSEYQNQYVIEPNHDRWLYFLVRTDIKVPGSRLRKAFNKGLDWSEIIAELVIHARNPELSYCDENLNLDRVWVDYGTPVVEFLPHIKAEIFEQINVEEFSKHLWTSKIGKLINRDNAAEDINHHRRVDILNDPINQLRCWRKHPDQETDLFQPGVNIDRDQKKLEIDLSGFHEKMPRDPEEAALFVSELNTIKIDFEVFSDLEGYQYVCRGY